MDPNDLRRSSHPRRRGSARAAAADGTDVTSGSQARGADDPAYPARVRAAVLSTIVLAGVAVLAAAVAPSSKCDTERSRPPSAAPTPPVRSDDKPDVSQPPIERVTDGLRWLAEQQAADGSWGESADTATTGIALLAFTGAAYIGRRGPFDNFVTRARAHLLGLQQADGNLAAPGSRRALRDHAVAALALVELYGMSGSMALREPAQRAVKFAERARTPSSGWGSTSVVIDVEATGWMSFLLESAKLSGLDVDATALDDAAAQLDATAHRGCVQLTVAGEEISSDAETAIALCFRRGPVNDPLNDEVGARRAAFLVSRLPERGAARAIDDLTWYFGTHAMWRCFGADQRRWIAARRSLLDAEQITSPGANRGSWAPANGSSSMRDRVWSTSLALLGSYPYACNWYPRVAKR
jgi:hypothetical protein